jgi:hypothetical protein
VHVTRIAAWVACVVLMASSAYAQQVAPREPAVDALVRRLEQVLTSGDRTALPPLFAASVPPQRVQGHVDDLFTPGSVRTAIFERDRGPLEGVPEGDGYRLVVEFFTQTPGRARILTAGLDVQRPRGGDASSWRISAIDSVSSVEGLYRLRLNTTAPLNVRNLELRSEDVVIALPEGTAFPIECDDGVTGLVLIGRGEMRFAPAAASERGQLRLFANADTLSAAFETAYIRFNPREYNNQIATATLTPAAADARMVRRAQDLFKRNAPLSFSVDLQDMTRESWHLLPAVDDFVAEVDTRRYDTLTYSRSNLQAEDVSLWRREDRRTIALYPSVAKLAARGRFYSDDSAREYDVLDYAVDTVVDPKRQFIQGRTRLSMRIRSTAVANVMLRLADSLAVTSVTSVEYGRLLQLRLNSQNMIVVNLPRTLTQDSDLTLVVSYAGRIDSQDLDIDTVQIGDRSGSDVPALVSSVNEPKYLLSNRSYWYAQNPIPDYATATMRVRVPDDFRAVASGEPQPDTGVVSLQDLAAGQAGGKVFSFRANQPLRYLALVVSRFTKVGDSRIEFSEETAGAGGDPIAISVETNPHQQSRGRALVKPTEDILRFYTTIVGDAPYPSATIALAESELPGGHSPAYFALLNEPLTSANGSWRGDPAAFEGFPDFFLAHELAHQWWGQAIGWKNYHEQWLSEGFSQYFAAMYAQKTRGDRVFVDMLRQFRRWSLEESDQGPVYLGYRLGHIKSDLRVFRALVYNKGAAVLHMLRRLLGDRVFFDGIRLFYEDRRYQKAGTDDFERAMETASGRVLDRFFERWIYNAEIPRVSYRSTIGDKQVTLKFEQEGNVVFDIPVTVTLVYANGRTADVMVPVDDKQVERTIPTDGVVREVQINRDSAALAEFDGR